MLSLINAPQRDAGAAFVHPMRGRRGVLGRLLRTLVAIGLSAALMGAAIRAKDVKKVVIRVTYNGPGSPEPADYP